MLWRIIQACIVGAAAWLFCVIVGMLLGATGLAFVDTVGHILRDFAIPIGALAGLWFFFFGGSFNLPRPTPPQPPAA